MVFIPGERTVKAGYTRAGKAGKGEGEAMKTDQRIIIRTDESIDMIEAAQWVSKVIAEGRVSDDGKAYCYHTIFGFKVNVSATRNKNSDTFYVYKVT